MSDLEAIFFWLACGIYALTAGGYLYSAVFGNERVLRSLFLLGTAGFVVHTLVIAARYFAQDRMPWTGDYENALMCAWFIVFCTMIAGWRNRQLRGLALATVPFALILLGYGFMRYPVLSPMAASLKSAWLVIHVYFAWLAFGSYALAMAAGVLYLMKERGERLGRVNYLSAFPATERLDELVFRFVTYGFLTDAIMIVAGAIWAKDLWGRYWGWDPVETWSLVSWLMYGIVIHLRVTLGWRGRRIAWLAIGAIASVFIAFFGVNFVVDSTLHFFDVR